jgi:aspartate/methionine/tyrosine aminotransferase
MPPSLKLCSVPDSSARRHPVYPLPLAKLLIHTGLSRWLPGLRQHLPEGGACLRYYSDRVLAAPLDELERAAQALAPQGPEVIDLALGSPRFDLLPTGTTKLPADRRGWPPPGGLPELRRAVADKVLADNCLAVDPGDEVLITSGTLGALQTALDALVNRGDIVVLTDPTAPLHPLLVRTRRARVRWLTTWTEEGRTRFRMDHLARALNGARMFVLSSPANPAGGVLAPEDLEQIAWWAQRHDVVLLSDEVFERYHHESEVLSIGTLPRARPRTLTAGSVSKGHALASARVGWLAGCKELLRPCMLAAALRTPFVPTLCQQLALAALRTDAEAFVPILAGFESRRRYAYERLQAMDLNPPWPAGAFFLWVPVWEKGMSGRDFATALLDRYKVLVTPGDLFGPSGAGYVRLSYAADDGRLQEGLNRIGELLESEMAPSQRISAAA